MSFQGETIAARAGVTGAATKLNMRSKLSLFVVAIMALSMAGCSNRGDYQLAPVSASASGASSAWVLDTTNGRVSLCEGTSISLKCSPQADPQLAQLMSHVPNK